VAAGISLEKDCGARDVPVAELQGRLMGLGAVLEEPKGVADVKRWDWRLTIDDWVAILIFHNAPIPLRIRSQFLNKIASLPYLSKCIVDQTVEVQML